MQRRVDGSARGAGVEVRARARWVRWLLAVAVLSPLLALAPVTAAEAGGGPATSTTAPTEGSTATLDVTAEAPPPTSASTSAAGATTAPTTAPTATSPATSPSTATTPTTSGGEAPGATASSVLACAASMAYGELRGCDISAAGEVDSITFTAPAFDTVMVRVAVVAGTAYPTASVRSGATTVCSWSGEAPSTCALGAAGTYTIQIADSSGTATGSYRVFLESSKAPSTCTPVASLAFGTAAETASIVDGGEVACFTLPAASADVIRSSVEKTGAQTTSLGLEVHRDTGATVCSSWVGTFTTTDCTLTGAAPYHAFLFADGADQADYTARFAKLNGATGCSPIAVDAFGAAPATTGAISAATQLDCWSFTGAAFATQLAELSLTAGSASLTGQIIAPNGSSVCTLNTSSPVLCDLGSAGTYTMVVGVQSAGQSASYALGLYTASTATGCAAVANLGFDQLPQTGSIDAATRVDCYSFAGTAGDRVRLDLSPTLAYAALYGTLVDAAGNSICSFSQRTDCTLTGSSPYKALVYGQDATVSGYELRANKTNAPTGCTATTLDAYNTAPAVDGVIDTASDVDCYTFTGAAFGVDLVRVVVTAGTPSPAWELRAPDGTIRCSSSGDSASLCSLSGAGTYSVLVYSYADQTGTYRLGLWDAKSSAACTSVSDLSFTAAPTVGSLAATAETDCYTFPGTASDVVRLTPDPKTAGLSLQGLVVNAAGQQVCTFSYSDVDCTLTGSAPFKAFVTASADTTGSYELRLRRLNAAQGCAALPLGSFGAAPTTTGTIGVGQEQDCFSFTGGAFGGQELFRLNETAGSYSARLEIRRADGSQVCSTYADQLSSCQFQAPGTYTAIVSAGTDEIGAYRLGWWNTRPASGCSALGPLAFNEDGVSADLTVDGRIDCYDFAGAASDQMRFRLTSLAAGSSFRAVIIDAAGQPVCSLYEGQSTCTLTGPGPFRALVHSASADTGLYELRGWQLNDPGGCTTVKSAAFGFGPVQQALTGAREADCFLFAGAVGDTFDVSIANLDLPASVPFLELLDPAGNVICATGSGTMTGCTLQITGPHALIVGSPYYGDIYGSYQVEGTCTNPACGTEEYSIAGMQPTSAGAGSSVTVDLRGRVLSLGDTVTLQRTGSTPITGTSVLVSEDRRALSVTFDLSGATAGMWDVVVNGATGGTVTLPAAFQVVAPALPEMHVDLVGMNRFVPGRPQTITVNYENKGNIDALGVPIIIKGLPDTAVITPKFDLVGYDNVAKTYPVQAWDQSKVVTHYGTNEIALPITVGRVPAKGKGKLSFELVVPTQTNYRLQVTAIRCFNANGSLPATNGGTGAATSAYSAIDCASALVSETTALGSLAGFIPGGPCVGLATGVAQEYLVSGIKGSMPYSNTSTLGWLSTGLSAASCVSSLIPGGQVLSGVLGIGSDLLGLGDSIQSGMSSCPPDDSSAIDRNWVTSMDPNEIAGPSGGGDQHAVTGTEPFDYTVYFENAATAGAPAQEVVVTDQLDPATFDLATFSFGTVEWGSESFEPEDDATDIDTVVDLRPAQNLKLHIVGSITAGGLVTWHLTSLDPSTDALPEDPSIGFLPPNADGTEGKGALAYTVAPKAAVTGDVITNQATITFDLNAPIATNVWSNLIDQDLPTSQVAALPSATSGTDIHVSWSGSDPTTAVKGYTIYVSTDGGPFVPWLQGTTDTSGTYTGAPGSTYGFLSVAEDLAGNDEVQGSTADATTTLGPIGSGFHAVTPFRALDSRTATGGWNAALGANQSKDLAIAGVGGIPASAKAVVMNVTVTGGTQASYLQAYPSGATRPTTANLLFAPGQTVPNLVTVGIGTGGKVALYNQLGSVHVIADVVGWYDDGTGPGDRFNGIAPVRALDSRGATGGWNSPLGDDATRDLTIAGANGVPGTATAVVMNVTVTGGTKASYLQAFPSGAAKPTTANLLFAPGQTVPNLVTVGLGTGGKVSFYNQLGSVHVIADVVGYYDPTTGGKFRAVTPVRVLDDRSGVGVTGAWGPGATRAFTVAGFDASIPPDATAAVMNITATGGTKASYLTAFPDGVSAPLAASLLFAPGQTVPNLAVVQLGANGKAAIYNQQGSVDVIGDLAGYFAP